MQVVIVHTSPTIHDKLRTKESKPDEEVKSSTHFRPRSTTITRVILLAHPLKREIEDLLPFNVFFRQECPNSLNTIFAKRILLGVQLQQSHGERRDIAHKRRSPFHKGVRDYPQEFIIYRIFPINDPSTPSVDIRVEEIDVTYFHWRSSNRKLKSLAGHRFSLQYVTQPARTLRSRKRLFEAMDIHLGYSKIRT